jgi:hypothetical protein
VNFDLTAKIVDQYSIVEKKAGVRGFFAFLTAPSSNHLFDDLKNPYVEKTFKVATGFRQQPAGDFYF